MHSVRCSEHHACAGIHVKQVLCASESTFAYTLARGCAYVIMYVQFIYLALGNEGGGVQLVYEGTCCLAWGIIFDRRRDRGVVCVFSIFNAGGSVCGCMCVYMQTHTHTHCTDRVLGCEPRGQDETPGPLFIVMKAIIILIIIIIIPSGSHIKATSINKLLKMPSGGPGT